VLKALGWGGGRHSILANTAIERIPTFQADHDYSQVSLGDAGIEFAEELFLIIPVFEDHFVFLFVRHEVPAFPPIDPSPELRVIHSFTLALYVTHPHLRQPQSAEPAGAQNPNVDPHSEHSIQSPYIFTAISSS